MTKFAQLVNACPPNETFVNSHCDPESGGEHSMQKYIYTCRQTELTYSAITGMVIGSRPVYRIRDGRCGPLEICITNKMPRLVASCVDSGLFDEFTLGKDGIFRPMLGGVTFNLEGLQLYSSVSESDEGTSVEVDKLTVQALAGNENVQTKKCRDCTDLEMDVFGPKTDSLKIEAQLLTTGAAAASILWLGFMSG